MLDEQRKLARAFAALPAVAAPPDFEARFWARIAREGDAPQGFAAGLRRLFSPGRMLALGAAAVAALLLFVNLPRVEPQPPRGPELTTAAEAAPEPATVARAPAPVAASADTDARIVTNVRDFELLQDPEMDAISELDVLEDWNDAGSS